MPDVKQNLHEETHLAQSAALLESDQAMIVSLNGAKHGTLSLGPGFRSNRAMPNLRIVENRGRRTTQIWRHFFEISWRTCHSCAVAP
jgi:hypothetical protein